MAARACDWPECRPPEPSLRCQSCGEPFTETNLPGTLGGTKLQLCADCIDLFCWLAAVHTEENFAVWPVGYALATLGLDPAGQRRAAGLYVTLGWCDPSDTPDATLHALLTDGAKPAPPDKQVRHDWVTGRRPPGLTDIEWPAGITPGPGFADDSGWQSCARCGEDRYHNPRW